MRYIIMAALLTFTASAQTQPSKSTEASIRAVLDAQVVAWNRGDIEGFMEGYEHSDRVTFVSRDKITHGWQIVLDQYRKNYSTREKMGTLAFSDLEINVLNSDTAVVAGRWALTSVDNAPHGLFTLIFRRTAAGWRIVHDHTSSAS